jgi:DNA repair exonuclease SbcCD ATPase subunit
MWPLALALALLLRGVCSGRLGGPATQLTQQLQAIQEGLEKVGDEDQKAHDKLACWCKSNLEEKERAVEGAKEQLSSLQSTIEAQTAEISRLESELKQHAEEIGENTESLNEAKAIRDKASSQFAKDESNHVANLDALDSAMKAIAKGSGISTALVVVRQATRRSSSEQRGSSTERATLLREGGRLDAASSPEVVYGVLKRMHATFSNDLEGMRLDESDAVRRHEELVRVKAKMVNTVQKQLESKKMRAANAKVQVTQRQAQLDKSQELLQVSTRLVAAMGELCSGNGEAFEGRQSVRQEELRALADARAEQASVGLLQGSSRRGSAGLDPAAEELCVAALGVAEAKWRERAKAACEKARAGRSQDAADDIGQLQGEIDEASKAAAGEREKCQASLQDAKAEAEQKEREVSATRESLGSDMSDLDEQIADVSGQASGSDKAKTDLAESQGAVHAVLQAIPRSSYNDQSHMERLKGSAEASVARKISEAQAHSKKLSEAAVSYDKALEASGQKVAGLLVDTMNAASKVLIPLRMMRADTEQDTLTLKEDHDASSVAAVPRCDPSALAAKESQLKGYASALGKAAEGLAFDALR